MPLDQDALDRGIDTLAQVRLESFSATPDNIGPFEESQLAWAVTGPSQGFQLRLNGTVIPSKGSLRVQPAETSTFTITAISSGLRSTLGRQTVVVDLDRCMEIEISELLVRAELISVVNSVLTEKNAEAGRKLVELDKEPTISVGRDGIHIGLSFKVFIDNFPDGTLDADVLVGAQVQGRSIEAFYRSFSANLDVPWYGDALILLGGPIAAVIFALRSSNAENDLKQRLLAGVQDSVDAVEIPDGMSPHGIETEPGLITVRVCPTPGSTVPTLGDDGFVLTAKVEPAKKSDYAAG